jgi:hypothetical protein
MATTTARGTKGAVGKAPLTAGDRRALLRFMSTYRGHEGVKRFWETWAEAIRGVALEIEECRCIEENRVLAITRAHGTGAGSGAPV